MKFFFTFQSRYQYLTFFFLQRQNLMHVTYSKTEEKEIAKVGKMHSTYEVTEKKYQNSAILQAETLEIYFTHVFVIIIATYLMRKTFTTQPSRRNNRICSSFYQQSIKLSERDNGSSISTRCFSNVIRPIKLC